MSDSLHLWTCDVNNFNLECDYYSLHSINYLRDDIHLRTRPCLRRGSSQCDSRVSGLPATKCVNEFVNMGRMIKQPDKPHCRLVYCIHVYCYCVLPGLFTRVVQMSILFSLTCLCMYCIYTLFDDTVSVADYIALKVRIISEC